jgi:hypothetical protein
LTRFARQGVAVGSGTVQEVCKEFAARLKPNWRVSNRKSPKYSLGWMPFEGARFSTIAPIRQALGHRHVAEPSDVRRYSSSQLQS